MGRGCSTRKPCALCVNVASNMSFTLYVARYTRIVLVHYSDHTDSAARNENVTCYRRQIRIPN